MEQMMIRDLITGRYVGMYEDGKYDYINIESRFGVTGVKMMFDIDTDLTPVDKFLHAKYPNDDRPLVCLTLTDVELKRVMSERNAA